MAALRERFGVSERRACTVVGLHQSTWRLTPSPMRIEEADLRAWLRTFSTDRPRWGWRRAATMAGRAGWTVNNKRIRRLWREGVGTWSARWRGAGAGHGREGAVPDRAVLVPVDAF